MKIHAGALSLDMPCPASEKRIPVTLPHVFWDITTYKQTTNVLHKHNLTHIEEVKKMI